MDFAPSHFRRPIKPMFCKRFDRTSASRPAAGDDISRNASPFQAGKGRTPAFWAVWAALALAPVAHAADPVYDTPSGQKVPRWAMLRKDEVYARTGPSKDNAIAWTYHAQSLPVQIISETRDWRLICDPDGGVAWVAKSMLQAQKTVLSPSGADIDMRDGPNAQASVKAVLRPRALASLDKCRKDWCKISAGGVTGWAPQSVLWGTQDAAACRRPDPFAASGR